MSNINWFPPSLDNTPNNTWFLVKFSNLDRFFYGYGYMRGWQIHDYLRNEHSKKLWELASLFEVAFLRDGDNLSEEKNKYFDSIPWSTDVENYPIEDKSLYLVITNGMEWRDNDIKIDSGVTIKYMLRPEIIRGRPKRIALIHANRFAENENA